ncbi:MAG: tetratricopeptide repeat protein [Campylobacterales bacterium]|nr:tetratricopeptide repeat protein [Campylobacterales bacterium]
MVKKTIKGIAVISISVFLLSSISGCSSKSKTQEYNKSADFWYQKITNSIAKNDLDNADSYFVSLRSEHSRSSYLPIANLMLAQAHMNNEEYLLAEYFYDEYLKQFGNASNIEYIEFMKLKASFLSIKEFYKDQKLILDTIANAQTYLGRYPDSLYQPLVETILVRLHMSQYLLHENIASLYDRTDKPEAAKIYREKNKYSPLQLSDIEAPEKSFIGSIFN